MKITRRTTLALMGAAAVARPAAAGRPPSVFIFEGYAIRGFDPVAYHDPKLIEPVMGNIAFKQEDPEATWLFASQSNLEEFNGDRAKYTPKYGGYCAYAVSKGGIATTDPYAWTIWEDRLYLNYSLPVRELWRRDIPGNIERADANWPGVLN
ncbi:MAG: YHS domain protein [Rhodobacteraceae bacterium]|nr:YHS domain protein [Paracoccaceae bacterium]